MGSGLSNIGADFAAFGTLFRATKLGARWLDTASWLDTARWFEAIGKCAARWLETEGVGGGGGSIRGVRSQDVSSNGL